MRRTLPAALICATIANIVRDKDSHPQPYTPAQFLPGAKTDEDELREFAEAVARGESFEPDPELNEQFKRQMQEAFRNIVPAAPARS
jgi:hypothetical protein